MELQENGSFVIPIDPKEFSDVNVSDLPALSKTFEAIPCYFYYKDLDSNYLGCNKFLAKDLSLANNNDIIGRNDKELIGEKFCYDLQKNDSCVLATENKGTFIEQIILYNKELVELQSYKYPLFKNSQLIGVLGISFLRYKMNNSISLGMERIYFDTRKLDHENNLLSRRQIECVKLLMEGMSAKKIAKTLNLSPRTVEGHISTAKNKLNCSNNVSLIAVCLRKYSHLFNL